MKRCSLCVINKTGGKTSFFYDVIGDKLIAVNDNENLTGFDVEVFGLKVFCDEYTVFIFGTLPLLQLSK